MLLVFLLTLSIICALANASCEDYGTNKSKCLSSSEDGVKCASCTSAAAGTNCMKETDAQGLPSSVFQCTYQTSLAYSANATAPLPSSTSRYPLSWAEFKASHNGDFKVMFSQFKGDFGKQYTSDVHEAKALKTFIERVKSNLDFNADLKSSYKRGVTKFTDLDDTERQAFVMPERSIKAGTPKLGSSEDVTPKVKTLSGLKSGDNCDLRQFASSVKDQGNCGSCYAFGTMAAAEASHFLWAETGPNGEIPTTTSNNAWQLSEQSIVDCCYYAGNNGCGGGGTFEPMQCLVDMGSVPSLVSYPYRMSDVDKTCSAQKNMGSAYVSNWFRPCGDADETGIPADETCLKNLIGGDSCDQFQTLALKTSIEVVSSFYDYVSGVYSEPNCPNTYHNHAVAIVGWGTDASSGMDYWIIRNSWGSDWADNGYILMQRGVNMCCVACENLFFQ